jgi:predicted RNA-binding Zn ribbon-like protein
MLSRVKPIRELPFVAGHVALDFVNTAEAREDPVAGDALLAPADLRAWGRRYDLIARSAAAPDAAAELGLAREARELLYRAFHARARCEPPSERDLDRLSELAAEAHAAGRLRVGSDGRMRWRWSRSELATVRHAVVSSAVELLQADPSPRFKECPGDHCGWLFLDTTKRGNRRWCQMRECGQEAKDKRRRQRRPAVIQP